MLIFITKLIKTTIPKKYRIVHWGVVHLESKLRRLVDWLHPSTCVLHNHVFHCLHSKVERAISHIFLKGEDIHNFFASCILKHSLKLENKSVSQWHVDHSHSSGVRWESKHTRGNFFLTLVWITIRVIDHTRHLKTSSFRVAEHPLSTHLKLLTERSLDIYVKTIYYFLLFHHSSFVADRFKWIWFEVVFAFGHHLHHFLLIHHVSAFSEYFIKILLFNVFLHFFTFRLTFIGNFRVVDKLVVNQKRSSGKH